MEMIIEKLVEIAQEYSCMIVTKDMWNTALGSVRKLQKIEQIIKDHNNDRMPEDYWYIDKIREVIKDGNSKIDN